MEQFGVQLKKLRESKNMSQAELAQKLFVSRSAVAKWEQGRGFPNIDSLRLISQLFEITVDELISDKEIKILQVQSQEKTFNKKRLYMCLSVFLCLMLCVASTLLAMYCPRKLSHYLNVEADEVIAIYVEKLQTSFDSNGGYYDSYKKKELKRNDYENFLAALKNITVTPTYEKCACASKYWFYIKTYDNLYFIDGTRISDKDGGVVAFNNFICERLKDLLELYGLNIFEYD